MKYPEVHLQSQWVHTPITRDIVEWCDSFAEKLAPNHEWKNDPKALTTSQLRKFFGQIRLIEADVKANRSNIAMLKPYLAYAVGRDKKGTRLKEFAAEMMIAIDGIRLDDQFIVSDYHNFISIYESIVAYHKYHGGKEN